MPPLAKKRRALALVALLAVAFAIGRGLGLTEAVHVDSLRAWMEGAGIVGFLVFVGIMVVGQLLQIPAVVFFVASVFAYGAVLGSVASLVAALIAVTIIFFVVRGLGGQPLAELEQPWARKILAELDEHPVRSVALLRLALWALPPLNYALAMSSIGFRDYFVGSVLGLVPPIVAVAVFFDWIARML